MPKNFTKEDFTNEELTILRMAFNIVDGLIDVYHKDLSESMKKSLYDLEEKLGIDEVLNDK